MITNLYEHERDILADLIYGWGTETYEDAGDAGYHLANVTRAVGEIVADRLAVAEHERDILNDSLRRVAHERDRAALDNEWLVLSTGALRDLLARAEAERDAGEEEVERLALSTGGLRDILALAEAERDVGEEEVERLAVVVADCARQYVLDGQRRQYAERLAERLVELRPQYTLDDDEDEGLAWAEMSTAGHGDLL